MSSFKQFILKGWVCYTIIGIWDYGYRLLKYYLNIEWLIKYSDFCSDFQCFLLIKDEGLKLKQEEWSIGQNEADLLFLDSIVVYFQNLKESPKSNYV